MIRKIIPTLALLVATGMAQAQDTTKQALRVPCLKGSYISVEGGYGIQTIGMDLVQPGSTDNGYGLDMKLGYRYYFYDHFGLGAGIRYQEYASSAIFDYTQEIEGAQFINAYQFPTYTHWTIFSDYQEKQSVQMLELPVEMFFQWNIARRWKLGLSLGLQANFLDINNSYEQGSGKISTKGYVSETNTTLEPISSSTFEDADYGYHFVDSVAVPKGSYTYDLSISGIGSLSFMYSINYHLDLMVRLNAAYGISRMCQNYSANYLYDPDCKAAEGQDVPAYNAHYNGALNTQASKPHLLSLGASVGFRYRFGKETPMELEFEDARRQRKLQSTDGMDFNISDSLSFDEVKRRRRQAEQDSVELAERERRRHQTDSIDIAMSDDNKVVPDTAVVIVQPEIPVVADNTKPEPEQKSNTVPVADPYREVDSLITLLNQNNCDFSHSDANQLKKQAAMLDRLAKLMVDNPDIMVDAFGHTCDIGSLESNKVVGQRRAESIRKELVNRGVEPSRIRCESKWWKEPLVPNTSEKNRSKNRRYELEREK